MTIVRDRAGAQARYTRVAIWLHWLIAVAIVYNLASGLMRPLLPRGFFVWHVSSGMTILALAAVRLVWRLTHKPPALLPMRPWEARLAQAAHVLLYCAMVALPLSGWALVSAKPPPGSPGAAFAQARSLSGSANAPARPGNPAPSAGPGGPRTKSAQGPTMLWGAVKLPLISPITEIGRTVDGLPRQHALHDRIETLHLYGAWLLLALLLIHTGGALKHQFLDRQREFARMGFRGFDR